MNMTTVAAAALTVVLGAMPLDAKTNVWYVSSDPTKGSEQNDGKTPETPFLKIDTAMSKCTSKDDFDEIRLLPGTYKTPEMENGYVKYKTSRIAIIGHTGNRDDVIIDGCGTNRGLYSDNYSTSNRLESVTVVNCRYEHADTTTTWADGGAGLWMRSPHSIISNCVFRNCHVIGEYKYSYGGAVYVQAGAVTLVDCAFVDNSSINRGGAVYFADANATSIFVERCAFTNNLVRMKTGCLGGALAAYCDNTSNKSVVRGLTVVGCDFTGNCASNATGACSGGAVYGRLTRMEDCTFTGNFTKSGTTAGSGGAWAYEGGASAVYDCCTYTNVLISCTFVGNAAEGGGGAVQVTKFNNCVLSNCTFMANRSEKGYGAACITTSFNRIDDCRFIANTNLQYNVANGIVAAGGNAHMSRCTFEGNVSHGRTSALSLDASSVANPSVVDACTFRANLMEADASHPTPYNDKYNDFCGPVCLAGSYIQLRNCLFVANTNYLSNAGAIVMPGRDGNISFSGRVVDNCTFVGNRAVPQRVSAGGGVCQAVAVHTASQVGGAACRNLLFSDNRNVQDETLLSDLTGSNWSTTITNCLFETAWTAGTCIEDGYNGCKVGKTVKFLNAAQGDYTLRRSSPARGAGVWIDWMDGATDLAGTPRVNPEFGAPDMGCYTCWHKPGLLLLLK